MTHCQHFHVDIYHHGWSCHSTVEQSTFSDSPYNSPSTNSRYTVNLSHSWPGEFHKSVSCCLVKLILISVIFTGEAISFKC